MAKLTILVTGATRGLGLAIARRLAREGYRVVGTGRRLSPELEALTREAPASGGEVHFRPLDLSRREGLHDFVLEVSRAFDGLYGLVNNAAVAHEGLLATQHETEILETLTVNVAHTVLLTKYALRPMLLARAGRVINIASILGFTGFNGLSVYGASKAALIGFTKSVAREFASRGITVNALAPGFIETDMTGVLSAELRQTILGQIPLGRFGQPEDIARAARFLAGPGGRYITGQVLVVDGGMVM